MDKTCIISFVWHKDICFRIRTYERDSSAVNGARFAVTEAYTFDWESQTKMELVAEEGDRPTIEQHQEMERQLFRTGTYQDIRI